MASTPQAFWQTLLAARSRLSEVLSGTTSLMDAVTMNVEAVNVGIGQTINVPIPADPYSLVTSQTGDPVFNDFTVNTVPIVMNQCIGLAQKITSFEQFNSPETIMNVLLKPGINAVARSANAYLAGLVNTTAFNQNAVIATTGGAVSPTQFLQGYNNLLMRGVNVTDPTNMSFVQFPNVWTSMLNNEAWTKESTVGITLAEQAHIGGAIRQAFGARMYTDQQMPSTGTAPTRTFRSIYMTKQAIAAAARPLAAGVPMTFYEDFKGLPIRIQFNYELTKNAWCLLIDTAFGASVVRPEQGQIFSTTEAA